MKSKISLRTWCHQHQRTEILDAFVAAGNELSPDDIAGHSHTRVRWLCTTCGERWEESPHEAVDRKSFCPFCSHEKVSQWYNLETTYPEIASQWDYTKNGVKTPRNTSPGNSYNAFWICPFDPTHRWRDRVSNRTLLLRDCPECKKHFHMSYPAMTLYYYLRKCQIKCSCEKQEGRYLIDLVAEHLPGEDKPLALEIDGSYAHRSAESAAREKRKDRILQERGYRVLRVKETDTDKIQRTGDVITCPNDTKGTYTHLDNIVRYVITSISGKQICPNHRRDHWEIKRLCYHEQKLRSLAVTHPELAAQWSPKNDLTPDVVTPGTQKHWLWICPKCNHEYPATLHNRVVMKSGCPVCSRKIATAKTCLAATHPDIAREWDDEKNGTRTPQNTLSGSEYSAWWRCPNGHSYQATVFTRTGKQKRTCPQCRSLAFRNPVLARYYDEERNPLPANVIRAYSNDRCHWKCPNGHTWIAQPNQMKKRNPARYCKDCLSDIDTSEEF